MKQHFKSLSLLLLFVGLSQSTLAQKDTFPKLMEIKTVKWFTADKTSNLANMYWLCPVILEVYDSSNNLVRKGVYCNGTPSGTIKEYYTNGNIKSKTNYINYLDTSFQWKRYKKDGVSTYYDSTGKKSYNEFWVNGIFINQVPDQNNNELVEIPIYLNNTLIQNKQLFVHELNQLEFRPVFKSKNGNIDSLKMRFYAYDAPKHSIEKYLSIKEVKTFDFNAFLIQNGFTNNNKIYIKLSFPDNQQGYFNETYFSLIHLNMEKTLEYDYYLVNNLDNSKSIKLKSSFILGYNNNLHPTKTVQDYSTFSSTITRHTVDSLELQIIQEIRYYNVTAKESSTCYDNKYRVLWVNKEQIYNIKYSSPTRQTANTLSNVFIGVSAFTSLFVAPLVSINYTNGEFNNDLYYKVAGAGLVGIAIGIPTSILTKEKSYSINNTQSKNTWSIQGFPVK